MTPQKLLRLPAVIAQVGLKRSAIYAHIAQGRFPQPRHVGRAAVWSSEEVNGWIARVVESGEPDPGTYSARNEAAVAQ